MDAKKCDRCGKLYEWTGVRSKIEVRIDNHPYGYNTVDLCPKCTEELREFLGGVKKVDEYTS